MTCMDGSFGPAAFNCIGDPYSDPKMKGTHGMSKGRRQFLTTPGKRGQTSNAIGYGPLEFKPMFLPGKDQYQDPHKPMSAVRKAGKDKFRTINGFGYSSPMKRSSGLGDDQATFRGQIEHLPDGTYVEKGVRGKIEVDVIATRNIQTSPGKRGGYGYAGTLLGGNVEYVASQYDAYQEMERKDHKKHQAKMGERKPFVSTAKRIECFDSNEHCAASKVFALDEGVKLRPKDQEDEMNPKERAEFRGQDQMKIFRPSSPPKAGHNGTLNPFPEAAPEPFDEHVIRRAQLPARRQPVMRQMAGMSEAIRERKPFRPSSGPRSALTRSVATMGLRA